MVNQIELVRTRRLLFALLGAVLLWIVSLKGIHAGGDDYMYAHALDSKTLVEWLSERRGYWSGRTLIDAVTLLLIQYEWLWRFLVVGVWLVMLRTIAHLSGNDVQLAGVVFVLLIPFAIRSDVLEGAAWWMTGSFNYLWPTSAAWLVLLVFLRPDMPSQYFWWCLVAALYAGSHEQVGLVLVAFQGVISITLVRRRQWRWQHGVLLAVALASLIVTVAAKGTKMRYELVTLYWFPEYLEWSLDERIFAGVDLAFSHFFDGQNHISFVLLVLLAVRIFQRVKSPVPRLIALMPVGIFMLGMGLHHQSSMGGVHVWLKKMWAFQRKPVGYEVNGVAAHQMHGLADYATSVDPAFYVHFFLVSMGVLCVGISLMNASVQNRYVRDRGAAPLAFCAALCASVVMGLSPTLYASGTRVLFVQDIGILFLSALVFSQVQGSALRRSVNVVLLALAVHVLWRLK